MEQSYTKIFAHGMETPLRVWKGHFATTHSHTNYFLDLTALKARAKEAHEIADALQSKYLYGMVIDTIVCGEGTEVIGAYLAEDLTKSGFLNMNAHKTIYIVRPEYDSNAQVIFRDNVRQMVAGKHVLILEGNISTGKAAKGLIEAILYYKGAISAVSAVFSPIDSIDQYPVFSVFSKQDVPDYIYADPHECPMCRASQRLDGLINTFGISIL